MCTLKDVGTTILQYTFDIEKKLDHRTHHFNSFRLAFCLSKRLAVCYISFPMGILNATQMKTVMQVTFIQLTQVFTAVWTIDVDVNPEWISTLTIEAPGVRERERARCIYPTFSDSTTICIDVSDLNFLIVQVQTSFRIKMEIFQNAVKYSPQKRTSGTYKRDPRKRR